MKSKSASYGESQEPSAEDLINYAGENDKDWQAKLPSAPVRRQTDLKEVIFISPNQMAVSSEMHKRTKLISENLNYNIKSETVDFQVCNAAKRQLHSNLLFGNGMIPYGAI